MQMADGPGRLSRAITLFLAEQIHLCTSAIGQVMQPCIASGGFVISGTAFDTETGVDFAQQCEPPGDYVLLTHLVLNSEANSVSYRLMRCIDGSLLDSGEVPISVEDLEPAFTRLAARVKRMLCQKAHADAVSPPAAYEVPKASWFTDYQLRLEQLLAIRWASMSAAPREHLSGEREIIAGMLALCLASPASVSTRILLLESLRRMKEFNPRIIAEFREKLLLLQKEHPLPGVETEGLDDFVATLVSD
jgi:hypothetical protein